jgi:hypothetical protein
MARGQVESVSFHDFSGVIQFISGQNETDPAYADRVNCPLLETVQRWLEERSFQPRPVNGKGAKRQ